LSKWLLEATIVAMKIVGIRDLKDRLSEYLRHVRRKGPVYVSNRGEIVAELRTSYGPGAGGPSAGAGRHVPEGLRELSERGSLRVGAANDPALYPVLESVLTSGTAETLLDEERG
jgi:antitoxin (DNA-binding transcriptional repressor) of toxin-antitoxin stability system